MIRLVATDLDNTFLPAGGTASDHALEGVRALLAAGVRFAPVTGRPPSAMRWMLGPDKSCYQTGAFVNGQMVFVDGRLVHVEPLDVAAINEMARLLRTIPGCVLAVYDLDDLPRKEEEDGTAYHLGATEEELAANPRIYGDAIRVIERLDWDRCIKANLRCDMPQTGMRGLRAMLRERFPMFDFVFPVEGGFLIDLVPAGWGKDRGIQILADHLGVGLDEVAAFGDSENDLPLLGAVENSVAVANASDAVARAARWHIGDVADDSVADALFQIAEASTKGVMPAFMCR